MANNAPREYFTLPVGRLIMGDPWNKQTKDQNNRDIEPDKQRFFFGVAVEKSAPGVNEVLGGMQQNALAGYAHAPHIQAVIQQGLAAQAFSWKVQDGDEMVVNATTGQTELRNKHAAGCWIFKFSTTLPINPAMYPPNGATPVPCGQDQIKKGYYVQVAGSHQVNGNVDHTAGLYLNPQTIAFVAYGEEIVGGPSLEQQFGNAGHGGYMPSGASATPLAPAGGAGAAPMGNVAAPAPATPMGNVTTPVPAAPMGAPAQMPTTAPQPVAPPVPDNPMGNPVTNPATMPATAPAPVAPAGGGMPMGQPAGTPAMPTASPSSPPVAPPGSTGYGGYMGQ